MSNAGYPYDNAPMEGYFNTLKNELINLKYYHNDKELNLDIGNFEYIQYNHLRPHSFNNSMTIFEARYEKNQVKVVQKHLTTTILSNNIVFYFDKSMRNNYIFELINIFAFKLYVIKSQIQIIYVNYNHTINVKILL